MNKNNIKIFTRNIDYILILNWGFIIRKLSSKNIAFKINIILKIIKKRPPYIEISSFNSKIYYFSLNR
jgi:hypothetical protein